MGRFEKYLKEKNKNNNIIETGMNINPNFWEDFMLVLNNSSGVSELLGVSKSKVLTWRKKIKDRLSVQEKEIKVNKKNKIIKTGMNQFLDRNK